MMEKKVNHYVKPNIKVNDFISRNHLLGWELGDGSTNEQLGNDPSPRDLDDPSFEGTDAKTNVWGDMQ